VGHLYGLHAAAEAVLLPREAKQTGVAAFQESARESSQQAFAEVTGRIGPAPETASAIDQTSLRRRSCTVSR